MNLVPRVVASVLYCAMVKPDVSSRFTCVAAVMSDALLPASAAAMVVPTSVILKDKPVTSAKPR